jgi:hypothetical protein
MEFDGADVLGAIELGATALVIDTTAARAARAQKFRTIFDPLSADR